EGEDPAPALAKLGDRKPSPAPADGGEAPAAEDTAAEDDAEAEAEDEAPAEEPARKGWIPASPLARRLAREAGIPLEQIKGSGPHGRIVKADVDKAVSQGVTPPAAAAKPAAVAAQITAETDEHGRPYVSHDNRTIKLSQMRKTIVKRMGQSKREAPHIYLTTPIRMDRAATLRAELNDALAADGVKISFNDLILKAVAKALRVHPRVNACYTPEGLIEYGDVHVGVAVALDDGLVVPVIRHADQKSVRAIAVEVRELAGKAKARSLAPAQMTGSTFTISNLGMFGIEEFMAVINPGEGGILAVGAIVDECVPERGQVTIQKRMRVTLCSDHRVFDGADNAQFLQTLRRLLEQPMALFT
ncbi:MAG: 2-oxo acid dehydrogenase subunit E2, partial [Myxococcales bacterium]|nr:2-oxo acid dehydrogenase subunit E2 [Myxococcales bacterium]